MTHKFFLILIGRNPNAAKLLIIFTIEKILLTITLLMRHFSYECNYFYVFEFDEYYNFVFKGLQPCHVEAAVVHSMPRIDNADVVCKMRPLKLVLGPDVPVRLNVQQALEHLHVVQIVEETGSILIVNANAAFNPCYLYHVSRLHFKYAAYEIINSSVVK